MNDTLTRRGFLVAAGVAASAAMISCGPAGRPEQAVRSSRIDTPAGTFDVLVAGPADGRAVLFLHGFPEFAIAWEHQIRALAADGCRVLAPDQRGYSPGVRPLGIEPYRLDHPVTDALALADAVGWSRFDLVGHDWGAAVGWIAAARHADRVRSLTAVAVPHLGAFADALRTDPRQQQASTYMDMFRQPSPIPEDLIAQSGPPRLPGVPAHRTEEYFRRLSEPGALTAALNWYRANDFTGYDETVSVPTLLVAGTADETVAPSGVLATRSRMRGPYRLEQLDGAGHNIPEQEPETMTRLLREHLATVPA